MEQPEFAVFNYRHAERAGMSRGRRAFFLLGLAVAPVVAFFAFPVGVIALPLPLIAYFGAARKLSLGTRYLLCGNSIVYYANVARLTLSEAQGKLSVESRNGKIFVLERERFPTGARKTDKVARNKAAKFGKVAGKIVDKVRKAAPAAELVGV